MDASTLVGSTNGSPGTGKVDDHLRKMVAQASAAERRQRQQRILIAFKEDGENIDKCFALLFSERPKSKDSALDDSIAFSDHYMYISKVPKTFLIKWMPSVSRLTETQLSHVNKQNADAVSQALCAAFLQLPHDAFGPTDKPDWKAAGGQRHADCGCILDRLVIVMNEFDFSQGGVYELEPPFQGTTDEEREAHSFTHIVFARKTRRAFDEGYKVDGHTSLVWNWNWQQAKLHRPGFVPEDSDCKAFFVNNDTFQQLTKEHFQPGEKLRKIREAKMVRPKRASSSMTLPATGPPAKAGKASPPPPPPPLSLPNSSARDRLRQHAASPMAAGPSETST